MSEPTTLSRTDPRGASREHRISAAGGRDSRCPTILCAPAGCRRWPTIWRPIGHRARGSRAATVLPNGLPAVVSFLAGSVAGTAAPLNPGYREEEFTFFLEDTNAKVLLVMAEGSGGPRGKAAAAQGVPVYTLEMDANGIVSIAPISPRLTGKLPRRRRATILRWCCTPAGAPDVRSVCRSVIATSRLRRRTLSRLIPAADAAGCLAVRDAAFHVHGLVASTLSDFAIRGARWRLPNKFNPLSFWRTVSDTGRDLVFGRADHPQSAAVAREGTACGARGAAIYTVVQRGAASGNDGEDGGAVWRSRAGSLRHDGSVASDEFESAAAGGAQTGVGWTWDGSQDRHPR